LEIVNKNINAKQYTLREILRILSLTVIIFLITFPDISPVTETGLDGSANFAFNYFFANGVQSGVDVIFTYGPLGFFKAPLPIGSNLVYAVILISFMRFLLIFLILCLGRIIDPQKSLLHFFIALLIASLVTFDLTFIGIIIASLLISHEKQRYGIWFFIPLVATVLAVLIKASIGVSALLIMISYLFIDYMQKRSFKATLMFIGSSVIIFLLFWFIIYGNLSGVFEYFLGTYHFIKGNSSAVALHPYNNWIIVISFILIFLILPFTIKDKRIFFLYGLILLSVFAMWKYSFSREENFHLKSLLDYLIIIFAMILVLSKRIRTLHLVLMAACLMLYYRNMDLTEEYKIDDRVNFIGINNFISTTLEYNEWIESSNNSSDRNILSKKLEHKILDHIESRSIDVYPWDYTYVAANDLNWTPRPVIQSYAAYTSWLDKLNARHFQSENAPELLIWELSDIRGGDEFGDVDERYMLNDEPNTIYQLLNNYTIISKSRQMVLFERKEGNNLNEPVIIGSKESAWNKWIRVPLVDDGILRAKLFMKGNILRSIRNLIYKDAAFFIEYKLDNGIIYKYRIVPDNAQDGIWINPLIIKVSDEYIEPLVTEIRFTNTVTSIMKDHIQIEWELISINPKVAEEIQLNDSTMMIKKFAYANAIFHKNIVPNKSIRGFNDFEETGDGWSENGDKLSNLTSFSGDYSVKLDTSDRFSPTYSITIGDLAFPPSLTININASVFVYLTNGAEGNLVIAVQNGDIVKYWNAVGLQEFSIPYVWNKVTIDKNLPQDLQASDLIKVYVWNTGKNDFYVDDFEIKIENTN